MPRTPSAPPIGRFGAPKAGFACSQDFYGAGACSLRMGDPNECKFTRNQTLRMNRPTRWIVALALLLPLNVIAQAPGERFSSLEERMTGREFRDAGLHKLTPEELDALNEWIRARSLAPLDEATAMGSDGQPRGDRRGFKDSDDQRPIETAIVGSFNGWSGGNQFTLQNGMVWRQLEGDEFVTRTMQDPEVILRPGRFGGPWTLQVKGYNRRTKVERVR